LKIKPPIPLFGVPIKGRINPILITLLDNSIDVNMHLSENTITITLKDILLDDHCLNIIDKYMNIIATEIGFNLDIKIQAEGETKIPCISLYSILTYIMSLELSKYYDVGIDDMMKVIQEVEGENIENEYTQFINACRQGINTGKPIIYRQGEGFIPINISESPITITPLGKTKSIEENYTKYSESIMSALTHIAGVLVIEAFNALTNDISYINSLVKLENTLWYILYNINIPTEAFTKWVTDINRAYLVKIRLTGIDNNNKTRR